MLYTIKEQNRYSKKQNLSIKGVEITPFSLTKVKELTQGKSLESNIELVKNYVILASKLAVAFMKR